MIQRNRGSSGPLSYIILLNGLSQEIKPSLCATRERFLFCSVFLFPKDVLKVVIKLVVEIMNLGITCGICSQIYHQ